LSLKIEKIIYKMVCCQILIISISKMADKLQSALALLPSFVGQPTKTYVWEQYVYFEFSNNVSIRIYFHSDGRLDEIHTVNCDEFEHEKITRRFRLTK
jgi:hypothetical protein